MPGFCVPKRPVGERRPYICIVTVQATTRLRPRSKCVQALAQIAPAITAGPDRLARAVDVQQRVLIAVPLIAGDAARLTIFVRCTRMKCVAGNVSSQA